MLTAEKLASRMVKKIRKEVTRQLGFLDPDKLLENATLSITAVKVEDAARLSAANNETYAEFRIRLPEVTDGFHDPNFTIRSITARPGQAGSLRIGDLHHQRVLTADGERAGRVFFSLSESNQRIEERTQFDLAKKHFAHYDVTYVMTEQGERREKYVLSGYEKVSWDSSRPLYVALTHGTPGSVQLTVTVGSETSSHSVDGEALSEVLGRRPSYRDMKQRHGKEAQLILLMCHAGATDASGRSVAQEVADRLGTEVWAATTATIPVIRRNPASSGTHSFGLLPHPKTQQRGEWLLFRPTAWGLPTGITSDELNTQGEFSTTVDTLDGLPAPVGFEPPARIKPPAGFERTVNAGTAPRSSVRRSAPLSSDAMDIGALNEALTPETPELAEPPAVEPPSGQTPTETQPEASATEATPEPVGSSASEVRETYLLRSTEKRKLTQQGMRRVISEVADRLVALAASTRRRGTALPRVEVSVFGTTGPLTVDGSDEPHTGRTLAAEITDDLRAGLYKLADEYTEEFSLTQVKPPQHAGTFAAEISLVLPDVTDAFLDEDDEVPTVTSATDQRAVIRPRDLDHRRILVRQSGPVEYFAGRVFHSAHEYADDSWDITGIDVSSAYFPHFVNEKDQNGKERDRVVGWGTVGWDPRRPTYLAMTHAKPGWLELVVAEGRNPQAVRLVPGKTFGTMLNRRPSLEKLKELGRPQLILVACSAGADAQESGVNAAQEVADETGLEVWASSATVTSLQSKGDSQGSAFGLDVEDNRYGEWKLFLPTSWTKESHPKYPKHEESFAMLRGLLRGEAGSEDPLDDWQEAVSLWEELQEPLRNHLFITPQDSAQLPADTVEMAPSHPSVQPALRRARDLAVWARDELGPLGDLLGGVLQDLSVARLLVDGPQHTALTSRLEGMRGGVGQMKDAIHSTLLPLLDSHLGDSHHVPRSSADLPVYEQEEYPRRDGFPLLALGVGAGLRVGLRRLHGERRRVRR